MPGPVPTHEAVSASSSQFVIAASRPTRRGIILYNDSNEYLYVKYTTGVTTDSFSLRIPPQWYGRMPWGEVYTGVLYGCLAAEDAGAVVQVTELVG